MTDQDTENEIASIRALSEEIIETVARIHPSNLRPKLGSFPPSEVPDSQRGIPGFNFSIPLNFDDGTEWVIRFPLKTRIAVALMNRKILSEVATIKWLKTNTSIPCPTIHAFDAEGNVDWNATGRHCLIMDRVKGRSLRNLEWRDMLSAQRNKVLQQIAGVMVELGSHHFDGIGSLVEHPDGSIAAGSLLEITINQYCIKTGHWKSFIDRATPYPTVMEYFFDLCNKRLLYETMQVKDERISYEFTNLWILRSLLPSLVLPEFNNGPFILQNGFLRREIVFFDEEYNLTGIINWEFSQTIPMQATMVPPPFLSILPLVPSWTQSQLTDCYQQASTIYRELLRTLEIKSANDGGPLKIQADLRKFSESPFGASVCTVDYILTAGLDQLTTTFWTHIFKPFFGDLSHYHFRKTVKTRPGVVAEFNRLRVFISRIYRSKS